MVEYKTIKSKLVKWGANFIEVGKREAILFSGSREYFSISRGYYLDDGEKRYVKSINLPTDFELRKKIANMLNEIE